MFNNYPEVKYQKLNKLLNTSTITSSIYDRSWTLILGLYEKNGFKTDYDIQFYPQTNKLQIYWTLLGLCCEILENKYIVHHSEINQINKFDSLEVTINHLIKFL